MISLGPFPIKSILIIVCAALAWLLVRWRLRGQSAQIRGKGGSLLIDMLLIGLVAARLGFVAMASSSYAADPMAILRIGDGGFSPWIGVAAALCFGYWRSRRDTALRPALLVGSIAGLGAWLASTALVAMLQASTPLPSTTLTTLSGQPITLAQLSGKPMVINLWATWCPPCQREMPVLAAAQRQHADIAFVLINQGEGAKRVQDYLDAAGLQLSNVLLDAGSDVLRQSGSRGLPTTLFFDAQGRLADTHLGELTLPTLNATLSRLASRPG